MSIVRAIDADNDWTFGAGANNYKTGLDALAQNLKTRLQSFLGDCFFDLQAGIDWFNLLGAKDQTKLLLDISAVILNTDNVNTLVQLSANLDSSRKLTVTYSVTTNIAPPTITVGGGIDLLLTEGGNVLVSEGGDSLAL